MIGNLFLILINTLFRSSLIYMFLSKKRKEIYIGITTQALGGSSEDIVQLEKTVGLTREIW